MSAFATFSLALALATIAYAQSPPPDAPPRRAGQAPPLQGFDADAPPRRLQGFDADAPPRRLQGFDADAPPRLAGQAPPLQGFAPTPRAILVTIDGARWQDVTAENMPALFAKVRERGVMWRGAEAMTSSLAPVSLPGYQTLMVGKSMCIDNACPRVTDETLPERIARELALPREQVAVFASWSRVARAATSRDDAAVLVDAPPDGPPRADRSRGETGPPWKNARWDHETARLALAHLEKHAPRFLYVSLLDVDEHAHAQDRAAMVDALRESDRLLARIIELAPDALIVVTTDHGRGPGPFWFDHRSAFPTAREIFVAIIGPGVSSDVSTRFTTVSQADVRPTIESHFGLRPTTIYGGRAIR